jgi:hypothetical protein
VTFGATIKVGTPRPGTRLSIRPEIRYDAALTSDRPFIDRTQRNQLTFAVDAILIF